METNGTAMSVRSTYFIGSQVSEPFDESSPEARLGEISPLMIGNSATLSPSNKVCQDFLGQFTLEDFGLLRLPN